MRTIPKSKKTKRTVYKKLPPDSTYFRFTNCRESNDVLLEQTTYSHLRVENVLIFYFSIPLLQLQLNLARVTSREIQMASLAVKFLTWVRHASIIFFPLSSRIFHFYFSWCIYVVCYYWVGKNAWPELTEFSGFYGVEIVSLKMWVKDTEKDQRGGRKGWNIFSAAVKRRNKRTEVLASFLRFV